MKDQIVSVSNIDSFGADSGSNRLLQGSRLPCVDGVWRFAKDDTLVPKDKRFFVLGTAEAQQLWQDGYLGAERIKNPGVEFLETIDELNAEIPQDQWEQGLNGPRPPWSHVFAVYLLDLDDGSIYTALNSTTGMAAAYRALKEQVRWKRAICGQAVNPIVTLGNQLHSKKWKKLRPSFDPVEWRNLAPAQNPALSAPQTDGLPGVEAVEPSLSEQMGDEVPWNDSPDINAPAPTITEPTLESVRASDVTMEAKKPVINKRGVQKI
jgi:hypothetical protein